MAKRGPGFPGEGERGRRSERRAGGSAHSVSNMFGDERAIEAVLTFLRDTKVKSMVTVAAAKEGKEEEIVDEGRTGPARPRLYFSLLLYFVFPSLLPALHLLADSGRRRRGSPIFTTGYREGREGMSDCGRAQEKMKKYAAGSVAAGATYDGISIIDKTRTHSPTT